MIDTVEEILTRVPQWRGLQPTTAFLAGGITNKNYRVEVNGELFVLRVNGANTQLLGISRLQEYAASMGAASIGVGPEVIYFSEPDGCLVTRFITGRPVPRQEMVQLENLRRVAEILKRVHGLPAIAATFSPFRMVEAYDQTARRLGVTDFPAGYPWLRERMREVEAAFLKGQITSCLCHNDLLNENFILEDCGKGNDGNLRIIDWEYAGMGDAFFDLANFAVHHGLNDEQDRLLLDAYLSPANVQPGDLARHRLMKIMSDFREAMWGMVQIGISKLDFDFRGYAGKHFTRMTESVENSRYPAWLATCSR